MIADSFDTSMSQKSRFKMQTQGTFKFRKTFPQLPWGTVQNPTYIQTAHGFVLPIFSLPMKFESFNVTHVQQPPSDKRLVGVCTQAGK